MCSECEEQAGELMVELINHVSDFVERHDIPTDAGQVSDITARSVGGALVQLLRLIAVGDPVRASELRTEAMVALSPNSLDLRPWALAIPVNSTVH